MYNITQFNGSNQLSKRKKAIKYIVIHYTASVTSKSGSALSVARYFNQPSTKASADFVIDDNTIIQYNPNLESKYCSAVGGSKCKPMTSIGGTFYKIATNENTVNIEICSNKRNRSSMSATDKDWYFTDESLELARQLCKYLMDKYNIPIDNVITHSHITGKLCPNPFCVDESRLAEWYKFKASISTKNIGYNSHISTIGWQGDVFNGATSGTEGKSLPIEALKVFSGNFQIKAQGHVQGIGWQNEVISNTVTIGTSGQSKRLEAIKLSTVDSGSKLEYRVHIQDIGWQEWKTQGQVAGTEGQSKRIEAIQIRVI